MFAVGAGGGGLNICSHVYLFSFLSLSLLEKARYRLKYCLKGPLNQNNQPTILEPEKPYQSSSQNFIGDRILSVGYVNVIVAGYREFYTSGHVK